MGYVEHQQAAGSRVVRCAVVTLSDTRTLDTDASGRRIRELIEQAGHVVARYAILPDDADALGALLDDLLADTSVDVILTNGGTGISPRDQTIDVVGSRLQLTLSGFGELFRLLSWEQIGSGAMLSRAVAGTANGKAIFALPGSTNAVELAMLRLILPELRHLMSELQKR